MKEFQQPTKEELQVQSLIQDLRVLGASLGTDYSDLEERFTNDLYVFQRDSQSDEVVTAQAYAEASGRGAASQIMALNQEAI